MTASTIISDPYNPAETLATRVTSPRLLLILRAAWVLLTVIEITAFAVSVPEYLSLLRYGCLCDSTFISEKDGRVVLLPFANGSLADVVQKGDVLVAVDGVTLPVPTSVDDARKLLDRGDAGTPITITVRTGDQAPRDVATHRSAGFLTIGTGLRVGLSLEGALAASLLLEVVVFAGFVLVALLIAWKRSDDWVALYTAAALTSFGLSTGGVFDPFTQADVFQAGIAIVSYLTLYIFPNGQIKPRWVILVMIVNAAWSLVIWIVPLDLSETLINSVSLGFLVLGLGFLIYRYRRYFTPLRRQQTKWVLLGIIVSSLIVQIYGLFYAYLSESNYYQLWRTYVAIGYPLSRLTLLLIPITFAFAVLRYRLWDIDLAVNRSLVYSAITLLLGGVFLLVFWVAQQVLGGILGAGQSGAAIAISAAVTALLFNPTRKRVQHFVDRRIYRLNFDLNQLAAAQKAPAIEHSGALSGRKLGEYTVLDVIGKGGMGEVYKGQANGQIVAIKTLPQDLAEQGQFRQRFAREAQTLTALHHPNIVQMLGSGEDDGVAYLAMEYIEGDDLSRKLKTDGALPFAEIRSILAGLASALDYAHEQGFVHRDIKPSNVMLRRSHDGKTWESVLMDFGIAKIREAQSGLTGTGAIGTIDYMAPEQIMSAKEVDRRADIYALGVMAYEMITGERPFNGSAPQIMFSHLQQPPPDPRDVKDDLPASVAKAVLQAMAKQPGERFQTAGEFAEALAS